MEPPVSMPEPSAEDVDRLDGRLVYVTTWIASIFAIGLVVIGMATGDDAVVVQAMAPGVLAISGWAMIETGRPSVALQLIIGMAGMVLVASLSDAVKAHDILLGFIAMGVVGTLFARRYLMAYVAAAIVGAAAIGYWHRAGEPASMRIQTAFGAVATYLFLAWLTMWLKTQWLKSQQELRQLIRSKDELVASVSHELRTPMTTVVGLARELNERFTEFSEAEVGEFLELIVHESSDVANILEDLLVAARADVGTLSLDLQPLELGIAIGSVLATIPGAALERRDSSERLFVKADAGRVRQILRNLVVNAARYGGPNLRIVIDRKGKMASISVCDDGPPIPPEERERMFEPYQALTRASRNPGSVGLGLTVSRELARRMGGDLSYGHDGGQGAFTLTLPIVDVHTQLAQAAIEVTPLAM